MRLQKQSSYRPSKSGSILVICMWILVFFSVLSAGLYSAVASWISIAKLAESRTIGEYMARAACVYFQADKKNNSKPYDSLYEFKTPKEKQFKGSRFVYSVTDEESKININSASSDIISKLPGMTRDIAVKISESTLKPFLVKEEILLVDGMTREIFDKFKDLITVHSSGVININTAPKEVLSILGMDDSTVTAIKDFRAGPDKEDATKDDGVFENTAEIIAKLRTVAVISEGQESNIVQLLSNGMLTTESKYFSLKVNTYIFSRLGMKYDIILDKERIIQWKEY